MEHHGLESGLDEAVTWVEIALVGIELAAERVRIVMHSVYSVAESWRPMAFEYNFEVCPLHMP